MQALYELIAGKSIPTQAQAEAYVIDLERKWGHDGDVIKTVVARDCGAWTRRVHTSDNMWDVWFEPNGRIYGEC